MPRPKRSSVILQKAEKRQAGLQSIDSALDLGNHLTIEAYSGLIETLRSQVAVYNSALSTLDDQSRQIKQTEQQLRSLSEQMLLGVAAKYGKNSREYGMAGGVPKSERRRPTRRKTTRTGSNSVQPSAPMSSTNGRTAEPVYENYNENYNGNGNGNGNSNGNGNGKATVS